MTKTEKVFEQISNSFLFPSLRMTDGCILINHKFYDWQREVFLICDEGFYIHLKMKLVKSFNVNKNIVDANKIIPEKLVPSKLFSNFDVILCLPLYPETTAEQLHMILQQVDKSIQKLKEKDFIL